VNAVLVYRVLIAIRGCWLLVEWIFGWGTHSRVTSFTLTQPYATLIADGVAVAFWLAVLSGMWFFQRWARLIFVAFLPIALLTIPFRMHRYSLSSPPLFVAPVGAFILLLTGAILAMCFLPPVRDCFATKET
jgi:hypothetical protein